LEPLRVAQHFIQEQVIRCNQKATLADPGGAFSLGQSMTALTPYCDELIHKVVTDAEKEEAHLPSKMRPS
jgi:hypothetical protein